MKFKAQPGLVAVLHKPRHDEPKFIQFDNNGFYETENPALIRRLQAKFESEHALKCKKCDAEFDNQGQLMAHYRKEHPKEN